MFAWVDIQITLSKFAWKNKVKGGAAGVAKAKGMSGTTLSVQNSIERNPPAANASTYIESDGSNLEPIKTSGVNTSAQDGVYLLRMVACALGLPEHFFGDGSQGNLATAKTMDRPTELKMLRRQKFWAEIFQQI